MLQADVNSVSAWAVAIITQFFHHHLGVMRPLASQCVFQESDWADLDWDGTASALTGDKGVSSFHNCWATFERANDLHCKFCQVLSLDLTKTFNKFFFSDEPNVESMATQLDVVRLAVVTAAVIEVGAQTVGEGESRSALLDCVRSGLSQIGLVVPVYISKAMWARGSKESK